MKRRALIILLLLSLLIISLAVPACIFDPEDKDPEIVVQPSEPPDNPPPPPPPPPPGGLLCSEAQSLETIAGDVLKGHYGPQLQRLLADEVSVCVNMMVASGMVSVHLQPDGICLKRHESESDRIFYRDGYLVEWILDGRYGPPARLNLHSFIRSFETENRIP